MLQTIIVCLYCSVLWIGLAHFLTCLVLHLWSPLNTSSTRDYIQSSSTLLLTQTEPSPPPETPLSLEISVLPEISLPVEPSTLPETPETPLSQKGIRELKAMASALKIRGYGKMNKKVLIEVLSAQ